MRAGATACGSGSPITRTTQAWDAARRLASETLVALGVAKTVGYQYADKVNRTALVWPDGWRVVYGYDPLNRLSSAGVDANGDGSAETPLALYRYDALSQLTGIRRGSASWSSGATSTDVAWKPEGLIDTLTHGFSGEVAGFSYGYDKSAKLTSESKASAFSWTPPVARTIAYDLGASGSATEKLDQYAKVNGQAATYDANGNRTLLAGLTTTHDSENRLVAASKTGMSVAYIYDAAGRRAAKDFASGGSDTIFLSAGDMEVAEYDAAGALLRRYIPGVRVDDRVAMIEAGGAISYYHPDRLGNVIAVTNSSGQVTDRYKYTPFGIEEPISLSGNLYRYTGRRLDPETGLYHYRARYYDPRDNAGSRFLETDPIGYKDQMNLYGYTGNNPLNATDPSGTRCKAKGASYDCTLDDTGYLTEDEIKSANKAYTGAVNRLIKHKGEEFTLKFRNTTLKVRAEDLASRLIKAYVVGTTAIALCCTVDAKFKPAPRALTEKGREVSPSSRLRDDRSFGQITIYRNAIQKGDHGETDMQTILRDLMRTFGHEAIHLGSEIAADGLDIGAGWNEEVFNEVHQKQYDDAANKLLGLK